MTGIRGVYRWLTRLIRRLRIRRYLVQQGPPTWEDFQEICLRNAAYEWLVVNA